MNVKKIIIIILLLSLIFTFKPLIERYNIEDEYKNIEMVLDYEEVNKLAEFSEETTLSWLNYFQSNKATKVSIQEESLDSLIKSGKDLDAQLVYNVSRDFNTMKDLPEEIVKDIDSKSIGQYDMLISLYNDEIFDFVLNGLKERYDNNFYKTYNNNDNKYIILKGSVKELLLKETEKYLDYTGEPYIENQDYYSSKIRYIGIGYDEMKISKVHESGMDLLLRPINYMPYSEGLAKNYIDKAKEYNVSEDFIIFQGKSILGYPDGYQILMDYIQKKEILPVLIETAVQRSHIEQDGINNLIYDLDFNGVRGFSIWDYIRERYGEYSYSGPEEIENSIYRAVTERNVRLIYFKPYMTEKNVYLTDKDEYDESFERLYSRLNEHDIKVNNVKEIEKNNLSIIILFIMFINVIIIGLYLLKNNFKIPDRYNLILGLLGLVMSGLLLIYSKSIAEKIFSLGASIVYAGFGINYMLLKLKEAEGLKGKTLIIHSMKTLTIVFVVSIIGGLITASYLSQTKYILEVDIFRGVKLSQLVPILVFIIFYIQKLLNRENNLQIYKEILNNNIKIYYGIILLIIGGIGFYYIARTGHETDIEPLQIEMIFRNFLESNLLARPRTKEFMFAAPSLAAALFFKSRKNEILTFIFSLGAVTGITSFINTFTHLRTPLYLSILRSIYSIGFSLIIALIIVGVLLLFERLLTFLKEKAYV